MLKRKGIGYGFGKVSFDFYQSEQVNQFRV